MASVDVFLSRLMPSVIGCPDALARQAILDSAIEFCEETQVIQVISEPQDVTAEVGVYDLDLPAGQGVVTTLKVWYGTTLLGPTPIAQVNNILAYVGSAGNQSPVLGTPTSFFEFSPTVIGLYPIPDVSGVGMFSARVATKPLRTATVLDDILYQDWVEAIVAGARQRIHAMPEQFFSSDAKAAQALAQFRSLVNRAKSAGARGRVASSLYVNPIRFA